MLRTILWIVTVVVLIGAGFLVLSYAKLFGDIGADVTRLVASAAPSPVPVVTDAMIDALPPPAQRYFRAAGVIGQPIPRLVRLKQKGRIRGGADAGWMTFEADETYSVNPPGFIWQAYFPSPLTPMVLGRDEYLEGSGSIVMKMLAALPVAEEHGAEMGPAGLMRYLNEMMWFPAAMLGPNIRIAAIDDNSFRLSIVDRGMTAEATLFVDEAGRVTNFRAQRFNSATRRLETWETPITGYGTLARLQLPVSGWAVWKLADGDFAYIELEVTELTYEN
ncbi:MAG: hypothetical protein HY834_20205 [Devosia nanyangense]|uniref:Uncharacterized protein n=1 Tax=Devosia nanyangense TaxID=1228055 RepID=A0A933NYK9_9HYPH|nr:hypothetical protein [Devosia nanyangense]